MLFEILTSTCPFLFFSIMSFATGEVTAIMQRPELYLTDMRPAIVIALSGLFSL